MCDIYPLDETVEAWFQRLMLHICIGVCSTTVLGKTVTLIYSVILLVGANYWALRDFLSRVYAIVSDFGNEKWVVDHRDILPEILCFLGVKLPRGVVHQPYLFPHAIQSPGWAHIIDGSLRLSSFLWFPSFLKDLKAVARFMHRHSLTLSEHYEARGLIGAAAVVENVQVEIFLHLRWGSIWKTCKCVAGVLLILVQNFLSTAEYIRNLETPVMGEGTLRAISSDVWKLHFKFVEWVSQHVVGLLGWGGSCMCHQADYIARIPVVCKDKGRLLPVAGGKLKQFVPFYGTGSIELDG